MRAYPLRRGWPTWSCAPIARTDGTRHAARSSAITPGAGRSSVVAAGRHGTGRNRGSGGTSFRCVGDLLRRRFARRLAELPMATRAVVAMQQAAF